MGDELGRGRCAGRDPEGGRRRRAFPPLLSQQPPAVHIRLRESRQGPSSGRLPAAANSSAARNVWNLPRPRPPASGRTGSKHQARVSARSARRLRSPLSGSPPSVAPANLATWGSAAGVGVAGGGATSPAPGSAARLGVGRGGGGRGGARCAGVRRKVKLLEAARPRAGTWPRLPSVPGVHGAEQRAAAAVPAGPHGSRQCAAGGARP